jgi:hypothetical protein
MSNIEQGMPNRRSKANPHLEIRYSLFDILRFKNIITIARQNGREFSSLAAIGGGLLWGVIFGEPMGWSGSLFIALPSGPRRRSAAGFG